jgi:hypothetical protein
MTSVLIAYAGFDPEEDQPGYYLSRRDQYRERAYVMFRAGRDTFDIAEIMKVPEHRVLAWITIERSKHRKLPNPYEVKE